MSNERPRAFSEEEIHESKRFREHWLMRKTVKDLREYIERSSPTFPNRGRVLELANELMVLVPPISDQSEQIDERRRKMDRGEFDPFSD